MVNESCDSPVSGVSPVATLSQALRSGWIEFWYQPKIDLRRRRFAGAEIFARLRHPEHGVLPPSRFMAGADKVSLAALTEQAVISALRTSQDLSTRGVRLRLAINVSLYALIKLPIPSIMRQHRPKAEDWPGLIFDVTEADVASDRPFVAEMAKRLARSSIRLAIDDFGRDLFSLVQHTKMEPAGKQMEETFAGLKQLQNVPFAELKLDRALVADCARNPRSAAICKSVIDLAHHFGGEAVAIGVEKAADLKSLLRMGCDVGQGFLFGQPMSETQFIRSLGNRAA